MEKSSKSLYSLRRKFSIIGLTGRMAAGCTKVSDMLCGDESSFFDASDLRSPTDLELPMENSFPMNLYKRKYTISYNFLKENYIKHTEVDYKKVLVLYILHWIEKEKKEADEFYYIIDKLFKKATRENIDNDFKDIPLDVVSLKKIIPLTQLKGVIDEIGEIHSYSDLLTLKEGKGLTLLSNLFFVEKSDFNKMCISLFKVLNETNPYLRTFLFHKLANNIRSNGHPTDYLPEGTENIYTIAILINRLIKAYKSDPKCENDCHIVINSLKNSVEIMYFKERYSAFYLVALNNRVNYKQEIEKKAGDKYNPETIEKLLHLDNVEYGTKDFADGVFSSPDVENCIQKAEIHLKIINKIDNDSEADFVSTKEQLVKILSLMLQPGIITPSNLERCMLIAYNSKYNSGCISRQVGAVLTDSSFSVKSVGWNDIPKNTITCLLKNTEELLDNNVDEKDSTYSPFEKKEHDYRYNLNKESEINKDYAGDNFHTNLAKVTPDIESLKNEGKNCTYCFRTMHNKFEGHKNQVHTRSLHAEENAMLQITKFGGQPLNGGKLFTTASPCELCAKKACQIGIKEIYYIDQYPGISMEHVLKHGDAQPELIPFKGVIGTSFNKLYEPFMSYKDEMSLYKQGNK